MRQRSGAVNRTWLAVLGVVLLVAGAAVGALALGWAGPVGSALGTAVPPPSARVFGPGLGGFFADSEAAVAVGLLGLVLAVLALVWLVGQVPRTHQARPFRLADDSVSGLTTCAPDVLTAAVAADAASLPGVAAASAVLRGTAERPQLTVRVSVNERADIAALLRALQTETAARLATAMETPLRHLAVQIDVTPAQRTVDRVVL